VKFSNQTAASKLPYYQNLEQYHDDKAQLQFEIGSVFPIKGHLANR
jgi:hypothetical protein